MSLAISVSPAWSIQMTRTGMPCNKSNLIVSHSANLGVIKIDEHNTHSKTIFRLSLGDIGLFDISSCSAAEAPLAYPKSRADWTLSSSLRSSSSTSSSSPMPMVARGVFGVRGEICMLFREEVTAIGSLAVVPFLIACVIWGCRTEPERGELV